MSVKEDVALLLMQNNISIGELAKRMKLDIKTLKDKLDNIGEFRISEVSNLIEVLHIQDPINFFKF